MVTVWTKKDNYGKNEDVTVVYTVDQRHPTAQYIHVGVYDATGNQISPWHYLPFDSPGSNTCTWDIPCYMFNTVDTLYDIQGLYPGDPAGNKKIHHIDHNQP